MASAPSHAQQRDDGVRKSLNAAGIRSRYHQMSLKDHAHPAAARLYDWATGGFREEPQKGFTFIGGNAMEDLAILTARGLHLYGQKARVMPLLRFQQLLSEDRNYLEETVADASTLLLTQAGPQTMGEEVFTPRERRLLEIVLDDWLADGNRLLLHCALPLGAGGWFSAQMLQRVAPLNETVIG